MFNRNIQEPRSVNFIHHFLTMGKSWLRIMAHESWGAKLIVTGKSCLKKCYALHWDRHGFLYILGSQLALSFFTLWTQFICEFSPQLSDYGWIIASKSWLFENPGSAHCSNIGFKLALVQYIFPQWNRLVSCLVTAIFGPLREPIRILL